MNHIHTNHSYRVDLDRCPMIAELPLPLGYQDSCADQFTVFVRRGSEPVSLSGMEVIGWLYYQGTRQTLPLSGQASGNCITLALTAESYRQSGPFSLVIQLSDSRVRHTVLRVNGCIDQTASEDLLPSGELLPSLPELLEQISDMQSATAECISASKDARSITALSAPAVVLKETGIALTLPMAVDGRSLQGLAVLGMTTQSSVPAPDTPCTPAHLTDPVVTLSHEAAGSGIGCEAVLRSIIVTNASGSTWSDGSSMYIADEADLSRGVITRRIGSITLNGTESWRSYGLTTGTYRSFSLNVPNARNMSYQVAVCTHYPGIGTFGKMHRGELQACYVGSINTTVGTLLIGDSFDSVDALKAFLAAQAQAGTPVTVYYPLAQPVEEAMDPSVVEAFSALHASTGMQVSAQGAPVSVEYIADTRSYIDARFAELSAALLNH